MKLSKPYLWLAKEQGPRHLLKAVELLGVTEVVGKENNPTIMGWANEVGLSDIYKSDETPWCGLFVTVCFYRAGRVGVKSPLWALSWNQFGQKVEVPSLGDVLTFVRDGGGHVGFYVGEDKTCFHVLGGNQGNSVSIVRIPKTRLSQARRPEYINPPSGIRKVILEPNGAVSINEA